MTGPSRTLRPAEVQAWRLSIEAAQEAGGVPLGTFNWPWVLGRVLDALAAAEGDARQARDEAATCRDALDGVREQLQRPWQERWSERFEQVAQQLETRTSELAAAQAEVERVTEAFDTLAGQRDAARAELADAHRALDEIRSMRATMQQEQDLGRHVFAGYLLLIDRALAVSRPPSLAEAAQVGQCENNGCERKAGHAGSHLLRCRNLVGCTEREGHRGRCTTGLWGSIAQGWANPASSRSAAAEAAEPECEHRRHEWWSYAANPDDKTRYGLTVAREWEPCTVRRSGAAEDQR